MIAVGMLGAGGVRAEPVVREELRVRVMGVTERWRLEWREPPELACFETEGVTCPCEGFAQGEVGDLDLVRSRPGAEPERLPLTPLFEDPATGVPRARALLRGWAVSPRDGGLPESQWAQALQGRKRARAMVLGDYDHDGQAHEFVLQTQALTCGMREAVLIGLDQREGRLRALSTTEHPERPLVMAPETWAKLRASTRVVSVETPCGDHGSRMETVMRVHADGRGLHATRERYECTEQDARGERRSSEVL
ncbi:MAG: hypothetical protein ABW123_18585 [Cystobacter sp.]